MLNAYFTWDFVMIDLLTALCAGLVLSNLLTLYYLRKKETTQKVELTKDANVLLAELLQGGAVVTVQVVNPAEIFVYSPKDVYQ